MWEQAPGHTLTNPSLLLSLCVRCVSTRGLCILPWPPWWLQGFCPGKPLFGPHQEWGCEPDWAFLLLTGARTPADTHASCTRTYNLHTVLHTHVYADMQTHVPVSCADAGRRCCFISRASSLQCPRFPAGCRISPRHQRTRFSSWIRTRHAWCMASHFWDVFQTCICLFFIFSCHLFWIQSDNILAAVSHGYCVAHVVFYLNYDEDKVCRVWNVGEQVGLARGKVC